MPDWKIVSAKELTKDQYTESIRRLSKNRCEKIKTRMSKVYEQTTHRK